MDKIQKIEPQYFHDIIIEILKHQDYSSNSIERATETYRQHYITAYNKLVELYNESK